MTMWFTHLKIALRNFRRQAIFSTINMAGLAVGLAACWLISLYILHEKQFDQHLPHADRVCMVSLDLKLGDEAVKTTNTPPPIGPRLAADFPEVELYARSFDLGATIVRRDWPGHAPLLFNEENALAVDTAFLELFGFQLLEGDPKTALDKPGSLVITAKTAQKYFGNNPAMGEALSINDRLFTITGIAQDLPSNTSVQFGFLAPMANFKVVDRFSWSWVWLQVDTWVRLREKPSSSSLAALEAKFPAMVQQYAPAAFERVGQNFEENQKRGDKYQVSLIPLPALHLGQKNLDSRLASIGDGAQVQMFGIAGALILLLACVNFMNLSTARSLQRAREVGVRKALGSGRNALIAQFISEAMLYSVAAMGLALVLAVTVLPFFNQIAGLQWTLRDLFAPQMIGILLLLPVVTGLLGGLYPAFYLSRFNTVAIFKGPAKGGKGGHSNIRSGLVVLQFSVSLVLMLVSFVVFKQLEYARGQSPGLQREHVLVIENTRHLETAASKSAFRQKMLELPEIQQATFSTYLPSLGSFGDFYEPEQGTQNHAVVQNLAISSFLSDESFVPALGIEILEGRNFLPNAGVLDSNSVIINETAAKTIGWEHPLDQWMKYPGNANQRFQVVGVMRDFSITSVKSSIEPMAIFHESSQTYQTWGSYMALRLKPGTEKTAIEKVGAIWQPFALNAPFEYDFLDASFARIYESEAKTGTILGIFTGLALLIGCLGLFALAAFTAEQRTKEIGIRKVLGASVQSITYLLTRDFLKLVAFAILLACPVAYYFMQKWLSDFVYRIDIHWSMFVVASVAAIGIAGLTVSYQSIRAAIINPVKSLKSE
jgi:putative ABC transport system permease protein